MNPKLFALSQRLADFAAVLSAFTVAYCLYFISGRTVPYGIQQFILLGGFTATLFGVVFHSLDLYEPKVSLLNVVETRRVLIGWALSSLILFAATFYIRFLDLSRIMVSYALLIAFIFILIERSALYHIHILARLRGAYSRPVVIFGAGVVGRHLFKRIYHSPALGLRALGFLDDDSKLWGKEVHIGELRQRECPQVLGGVNLLQELRAKHGLKEVFLAMPNATHQRNTEITDLCRTAGVAFSVVPPTYGRYLHNLEVEDIGGIPVIREKIKEPHLLYPFLKRAFDLFVSSLALLLLSPLLLVLGLMVKLGSDGPCLFRQKRVGKGGEEFDFFKFRTMYTTSNPYAITPQSGDDPRITPFGRWLRRSSLDELPQFWNVFRGEMSIVGPRPEMPFIVKQYTPEQRERLKIKPGITGVWQISAVRGEPIHANMEYDLFYIEHQSVLLDLIIMIKTVVTAVRGIGAF